MSFVTKRAVYEVVAVLATAILHPVFVEILHQRAVFIGVTLAGWLFYFGVRLRRERGFLQHLGFRAEGLAPAFVATSVFAGGAIVIMSLIACADQTLVFRWQMLLLLALYPIWGMLQQALVQGVFVRSVASEGSSLWLKLIVAAVAAILFGAIHLPDLRLAGATALIGAVFTLIYLRWGNLWPLGLYHGWLGVFFYYWVLVRDPWAELTGLGK